ncbi:helix-turn-helix transcriptional regulator [Luteococcus sp. OSA5]|uniref:helix-turn-helix transcriptional regulator n=1 Tax=Luteococcus sp. OSA5 TaxID=3401630 RepID=UPI003B42B653
MSETTHRVLRLLGLLESRTSWQGAELASRLGVTERTVRRDVTRLRELGYPVESERGLDGGYRLGAGRRLPPLLLEDEEAVALVACLRMAALAGTDTVGEVALRALTKLDQVLPPKLRALASALDDATQAIPRNRPAVDLAVLQELSVAQRDCRLVRFSYDKPDGSTTSREVEPARLMTQGERWYLQGFDRGREDWRVFRLDRMSGVEVTTWSFTPRAAPPGDFQRDLVSRYPCVVEVEMAVDVEVLSTRIPAAHRDHVQATPTGCRFRVGGPTWEDLAWHMLWVARDLGAPLVLAEGPPGAAMRQAMRAIATHAEHVIRQR